jgi:acyl carrier protein
LPISPSTMNPNNIEKRVKSVLIDQLGFSISPERIHRKTSLYGKGLGLDSVDLVTLVTRLEEEFDIFFEPEEISPSTHNFGLLLETVERKLNGDGNKRGV